MTNLIYTSYYANYRFFDEKKFALISISGKPPANWNGETYKKLAPSWSIWREWHDSRVNADKETKELANAHYTERFKKEVLAKLNPMDVLNDIRNMSGCRTPVLMCYERPDEFCHRHLVAKWLLDYSDAMLDNDAGYDNDLIVREYENPNSHDSYTFGALSKIAPCCKSCDHLKLQNNGEYRCLSTKRIDQKLEQAIRRLISAYGCWNKNGTYSDVVTCFLNEVTENLTEAGRLFTECKNKSTLPPMNDIQNAIVYCESCEGNSTDGNSQ